QGLLNCLVRTVPYDTIVRVPRPREGFSTIDFTRRGDWYQIHPTFGEGTPIMENEYLCNPETKIPISIVHLYDRMPEWRRSYGGSILDRRGIDHFRARDRRSLQR